jgi:hypothetical protein
LEEQVKEVKIYRLSRAGKRMAYLLLVGSTLIWLFALWTLKNTLKIALNPQNLLPSVKLLVKRLLGIGGANPLTPEEAIPALIMLVLAVVVPLLIWNIVEELRSSYTVRAGGITFRSLGIELSYAWEEIAALRPVDNETEDALDELVLRTSHLATIRSPLVRFLHWQAYGPRKLALFGGLENREELLATIRDRMAAASAQVASAPAAAEPPPVETASRPVAAGEGQDSARGSL